MKKLKFVLLLTLLAIIQVSAPQKASAQIIDIPLLANGSYDNAGGWGMGNKDYRTYGSEYGNIIYTDASRPKNILTYDTNTNKVTLNYELHSNTEWPNYYTNVPRHTNAYSYSGGQIWIGVYGSGVKIGDATITRGTAGGSDWDLTVFSGTWTLPNLSSLGLYSSCGGFFFEYTEQYLQNSYSQQKYMQFDASTVLYNKTAVGSSYNIPITVVNGKEFSIKLPNSGGKFIGSQSIYGGTIKGNVSGTDTVLSGTLYSAPSTYTNVTIGSDTIQIKGVNPPTTSPITVRFY